MDGWAALRHFVVLSLAHPDDRLLAIALSSAQSVGSGSGNAGTPLPPSTCDEADRLRALIELAQGGDAEAFGQLYDHYVAMIYRLIYYRVGSKQLAEDITSDTFVRALRSIGTFTWQGKDFGAWLTTIARNLIADHYKSSRQRMEVVVDAIPDRPDSEPSPEDSALAGLTNADLMRAVHALPALQRDCLLMRFIEGLSISETAQALGRSDGAVKQLQLRAVRNLARSLGQGSLVEPAETRSRSPRSRSPRTSS